MLTVGSRILALFALVAATPVLAQEPRSRLANVVVGDLRIPDQRAAFNERAQSRCGRPITVVSERRPDATPAGTLIEQRPPAGQSVACISSVTLVYSTGPLPTPPTPPPPPPPFATTAVASKGPPPPPPFPVGVLDSVKGRESFESRASRFCERPYRLGILFQPDSRAPGTYVTQNQPPASPFTCAMVIIVTVTSPLPAWLMPDFRLPGAAMRLQQTAVERCRAVLSIQEKYQDSDMADGTLIWQDPGAGTPVDCNMSVTLTRARSVVPPPPTQLIGDLSTEAGIVAIETVAQRCPDEWRVKRDHRPSSRNPKGAFDGQNPGPTTEFHCELGVTVWTSDGEQRDGNGKGEQVLLVPDFVGRGIGAIDTWIEKVTELCGSSDGVSVADELSEEQPGTILSQSLAAGTPYNCGDPVEFAIAVSVPQQFPRSLVAIASGLVAAAGLATYFLRTWPWPPIPKLELGVPVASASPADDGPAVALPLVVLEALRPEVTFACPDGVPIESVETNNG